MTKANFRGIVRLRLSTTGTTRIGTFIFVNWVKVSWFLALTDEDSFERGVHLELVVTGKLRPTESEATSRDNQAANEHRGEECSLK